MNDDNSNGDIVCVEWSKHTKQCHHTSPCYVMADGSGPCGDLDTQGDSVIAYCLEPVIFIIQDWTGKVCFHGKEFSDFEEAWGFIREQEPDEEAWQEYSVIEKKNED